MGMIRQNQEHRQYVLPEWQHEKQLKYACYLTSLTFRQMEKEQIVMDLRMR